MRRIWVLALVLLTLSLCAACSRTNPLIQKHDECWTDCEKDCGGNADCIRYCRARRCNSD